MEMVGIGLVAAEEPPIRQDTLLGPAGSVVVAVAATDMVLQVPAEQVEKMLVPMDKVGRLVPVVMLEPTQDRAVEVLVITPQ